LQLRNEANIQNYCVTPIGTSTTILEPLFWEDSSSNPKWIGGDETGAFAVADKREYPKSDETKDQPLVP